MSNVGVSRVMSNVAQLTRAQPRSERSRAAEGGGPPSAGAGPRATLGERIATARWEALGTGVVLRVGEPAVLAPAQAVVAGELDAIDRACSRFRADSDLSRVNALAGGRAVRVAPLLVEALEVALRAAELTDGAVDPTVGAALALAGYDRDWRLLEPAGTEAAAIPVARIRAEVRSGWRTIELDAVRSSVRVPRGIALDLGASAKAWAADRAARAVHEACRCSVLISIGGDIATAGTAPAGGWRVHVTDDHRARPDAPGQTISIAGGGLATSSTATRRWRRGGSTMHHIIDPATGAPARGAWRTVSVAAADCTDANIASTAALVLGDESAVAWLAQRSLPARLVDHRGGVRRVGDWPVAGMRWGAAA
jgi:thiamine biosynthesis lipoprotein ApbE